jgi:hypothetical protein
MFKATFNKQHCNMKIKFCTNAVPGFSESKSLGGQNLAYVTKGNGSINIVCQVSDADLCEPFVF